MPLHPQVQKLLSSMPDSPVVEYSHLTAKDFRAAFGVPQPGLPGETLPKIVGTDSRSSSHGMSVR